MSRMKTFFELDLNEDYKRSQIVQYILAFLTLSLSILTRTFDQALIEFSFIFEIIIIVGAFNFYFKAQKNRNYAFWGISGLLGLFFLKFILKYTFIHYNLLVLYLTFLAMLFLAINCYIMSSPLFYPRVQWWEYDFRYRGDLKSILKIGDKSHKSRITDLRRGAACVESFENIPLNEEVIIEYDNQKSHFELVGVVKTSKEIIQGRPIRYGVEFYLRNEKEKKNYNGLLKVWNNTNRLKIRRKFEDLKGKSDE
tara:strand:- start:182871 stop:183629 length:759 start_codon:yes stop_codon:yes gene_type:complete